MAPHSSALAWRIPWMEEPGGLQSMGLRKVRHDWATSLSHFTFRHWRRNWHPLQYSCLENPRDGEPGGLPSMGSHRVRHNWCNLAAAAELGCEFSEDPETDLQRYTMCFSWSFQWIELHWFGGKGWNITALHNRRVIWNFASLVAWPVKNPPAMQQTWVWSPGLGRSPGEGSSNPFQYSGLGNSMDRRP